MKSNFIVSGSPHIHDKESIHRIMWTVVASLIPAGIAGVIIFGLGALWVILVAILAAVSTEWVFGVLTKKKITILDGSAVITGILLAFNLPPNVPLWLPVVGAVFSIAIGKQVFGGLGQNIFNPALVGRVFLMASWPKYMTTFPPTLIRNLLQGGTASFDAVTSATPLMSLKESIPSVASRKDSKANTFSGFNPCITHINAPFLFMLPGFHNRKYPCLNSLIKGSYKRFFP